MDMPIVFALKMLAGVAGVVVGMLIGCLYSAIWLRLAAAVLRFGNIPYLAACRCTLIANFVVAVLNFSIGFNHGLTVAVSQGLTSRGGPRPFETAFMISPLTTIAGSILGLLVTAAIFCRMIPRVLKNEDRLLYSDSLALTGLYFAFSVAGTFILGLFVYCFIIGSLSFMG